MRRWRASPSSIRCSMPSPTSPRLGRAQRAAAIDVDTRKRTAARAVGRRAVRGEEPFDVAGLPTRAGSRSIATPPATRDVAADRATGAAGAVLVGALNMGEYAYDFTGENVHDGPSRNPHDTCRMTGGSSGGSGGAVAGAWCRCRSAPTPMARSACPFAVRHFRPEADLWPAVARASFPFVSSLDHLGPLARTVARSGVRLRRHAGPRCRRPVLRAAAGGADAVALCAAG